MAGDEESKRTRLRFSLLDVPQRKSLIQSDLFRKSIDEDRKKMHQEFWERQSEALLQEDADAKAERIASQKRYEEQRFIQDVKRGYTLSIEFGIQSRINVNAQDKFGMTALHYAAATGFRPCIRLLVNSGLCNYLLKDNKGRLASELAYEWGKDYAVGLLLQKKEVRQAYEESRSPPVDTPGGDAP
jgi:hypothetical protein